MAEGLCTRDSRGPGLRQGKSYQASTGVEAGLVREKNKVEVMNKGKELLKFIVAWGGM